MYCKVSEWGQYNPLFLKNDQLPVEYLQPFQVTTGIASCTQVSVQSISRLVRGYVNET